MMLNIFKRRIYMKKRRLVIVAFLLCACMVIGIGYAAVSRSLYVLGTINIANSNIDVVFTRAGAFTGEYNDVTYGTEDGNTKNYCTGATIVTDDYHVRLNTDVMNDIGQSAVAIFTITNRLSTTDVSVSHPSTNPHSISGTIGTEYFTFSHKFVQAEGSTGVEIDADGETVTKLPAGQSVRLIVSISVAREITADLNPNESLEFTATYNATALSNS